MSDEKRSRWFNLLLYPDNPAHNLAIMQLQTTKYMACGICHNQDCYTEDTESHSTGELKKAHFHFILRCKNPRYKSGVAKELEEMDYAKENVETYLQLFEDVAPDVTGIRFLKEKLGDCLSEETADSMEMIISSVETAKECEFNIKFDPTLVRGQSYYTGTIFEVTMDDFGGSVAGGGRYDKMIGKFTGQDTPACGFSIGFERIVMLLLENGYEVPTVKEKKAYLLEKKMTKEGLLKVMSLAKEDRMAGKQVLIVNMKKNKKFQKEQLTEDGYTEIVDCYADSVENL